MRPGRERDFFGTDTGEFSNWKPFSSQLLVMEMKISNSL